MEQEQFKKEILPLRAQLIFYAQRLLDDKDDAEDVIQEVFLKLWHIRGDLNKYDSVLALSMKMTKHLCLNLLKSHQRNFGGLSEVVITNEKITPHYQLEQKDNLEQVMRIIDRLPNLQQAILRMKHLDGFETEEIAEITGSSVDAVKMNLSRARKRVKEMFIKI